MYEHKAVHPVYLNTKDQYADVLTKGLNPADHVKICRKFMFLPDRLEKSEVEVAPRLAALAARVYRQ